MADGALNPAPQGGAVDLSPAIESLNLQPAIESLNLEPAIESPDDFYEALLDAHAGLSAEQSADLNARLVLLLANQVGRLATLRAAVALARSRVAGGPG